MKRKRICHEQGNTKEIIRQVLPELLRLDPDFRSCILEITGDVYTDQKDWFYEMLGEMRRERERQDKKWDEYLKNQEVRLCWYLEQGRLESNPLLSNQLI